MLSSAFPADVLWRNAWAVVPLLAGVGLACRLRPLRPATKHLLWLVALLAFVVPLALPALDWSPLARGIADKKGSGTFLRERASPRPAIPESKRYLTPFCDLSSTGSDLPVAPAPISTGSELSVPPPPRDGHVLTWSHAPIPASSNHPELAASPDVPPASPPAADPPRWKSYWNACLAARDALLRLPPVSALCWICGGAVLIAWQVLSWLRFQWWLRRARPAPPEVVSLVRAAAETMGLRRPPAVCLLDAAVSPMICWGRRVRLVLPARLWYEFDEVSRRAILCHELAHLRRRDHWVCWLEVLVAALYWWHPLVWWVRRRLRQEADASCDAWVTWLMPRRRREYACALLRTSESIGRQPTLAPACGLQMTSAGAKRLARRIKMIMTTRTKPGTSWIGALLVLTVATVGWLAAPAWAWPEARPAAPSESATSASHATTLLATLGGSDDEELEERLHRLEAELDALARELRELRGVMRPGEAPFAPPGLFGQPMPAPPGAPAPRGLFHPSVPVQPLPTPPAPRAWSDPFGTPLPEGADEQISRSYYLPPGKLEALAALMVRDDVPIMVSPQPDRIDVVATPRQHASFGAFVKLIHPEARVEGAGLEESPDPLSPAGLALLEREGGRATAEMMELREVLAAIGQASGDRHLQASVRQMLEASARLRHAGSDAQAIFGEEARKLLDAVQFRTQEIADQTQAVEKQRDETRRQAEQLFREAERCREKAAEAAEREGAAKKAERAQELRAKAETLAAEARNAERGGQELEERILALENKVAEMQAAADRLAQLADQLEEALENWKEAQTR